MDHVVQGLRHQDPNLFMQAVVKAKNEPVDLEILSVKVQSIPKKLHKMNLVLWHHKVTLSQGIELIEMTFNEFP